MALVQSGTLPQLNVPLSPILSTLHAPSSIFLRREIRLGTSPLSSSTDRNLPFSPLTHPRKLLCPPPRGKFVREDYLVELSLLTGKFLPDKFAQNLDIYTSLKYSSRKLSAQELQDLVKGERKVPLIVDFYATWCGPCILMAQELETLAVEYESNAMIVKVDTDDEYEFARDMQVRGLPTLFFISPDPSKDAIRTEGLIPLQMMRDIIDNDM